jgi:hypothetical protein
VKLILLCAISSAIGCSFNPGKDSDLGSGGGDDLGGIGDDMSTGPDMTMICTPSQKTCASGKLSTCNLDGTAIDTVTCVLGCNAASTDCASLQPTAPAVASDFIYGGLSDLTIAASQTLLVFDTDTGEIKDNTGATIRMPNPGAGTRYVENGIGFHRVNSVGIWTFSNLSLPTTATVVFKNPSAASILSPGNISIAGTIDLRGYGDPTQAPTSTLCAGPVAGPGGTAGGMGTTAATGAGAGGQPGDSTAGGGGASYGDVGGDGGKNGGVAGGKAPTTAIGNAAINPLAGGFGGGSAGGNGGGGGGGLQLAAEGTITISGTINAGGCGGAAGDAIHGGGGGGSGGAILIEAPTVHVTASAHVTANGGGGAGGGSATATAGDPGGTTTSPANGGSGPSGGHNGGNGGSQGTPAGNGLPGAGAGGGGGAIGRIRFNGQTAPTVDAAATISPTQTTGSVVVQ